MKLTKSGFTIVELLIVIVVVAVLAAISVVAFNGVRERAKVSAVADQLSKIEKALRVEALSQGTSAWWTESELTCASMLSTSRSITAMAASCDMPNLSFVKDLEEISFGYDNDGDTATSCSSATGVNIMLLGDFSDTSFYNKLNQQIDNDSTNCGKVSYYDSTRVFYRIALYRTEL